MHPIARQALAGSCIIGSILTRALPPIVLGLTSLFIIAHVAKGGAWVLNAILADPDAIRPLVIACSGWVSDAPLMPLMASIVAGIAGVWLGIILPIRMIRMSLWHIARGEPLPMVADVARLLDAKAKAMAAETPPSPATPVA